MSDTWATDTPVDTGFGEFTAAVNPEAPPIAPVPAPIGLTPEGLDALRGMIALPKEFGPVQMVALARDLAINLNSIGTILINHKLTNAQYEFLRDHNEFFQNALKQQATEWQGVKSTADRLKIEAQAALEEQMPVIASRMGSRGEKLIDTVEAAKFFAKVAGVDGDAQGARRGGEGFTITIDLGSDQRLTIGPQAGVAQGAVPPASKEIQGVAERLGDRTPIRSEP